MALWLLVAGLFVHILSCFFLFYRCAKWILCCDHFVGEEGAGCFSFLW